MIIDPIPATPLEAAIQDVRIAQGAYDEACNNLQQIIVAHKHADEQVNDTGRTLRDAREKMYEAVVEPTRYTSEPIRVLPTYRDEAPQIEEGVDAAWSDKGPEA
jgi:hypothetical protein